MIRPVDTLLAIGAPLRRRVAGLRRRLGALAPGRVPTPAAALPDPIHSGDAERGRALLEGSWCALGYTVPLGPEGALWQVSVAPRLENERQSFAWLDDLAALGSRAARAVAQALALDWCRRFGAGAGPGWQPDITGRRLRHWAIHAAMLADGLEPREAARFWRAFGLQARHLARFAPRAPEGLPRVEALAGLALARLVLPGRDSQATIDALGRAAEAAIDAEGGTPSRAPEDLASLLVLLIWTARLLEAGGQAAAPRHLAAIGRAVPVVRALRLGDGTLARFHGGGPFHPDRLDQALAELRLGPQQRPRLPMGYARLAGGRLIAIMDGAAPPAGVRSTRAGAGTLGFELSIGRRPVVVNVGPGRAFGPDWARAARATARHSTLEIDGISSSRLARDDLAARAFGARLASGPTLVTVRQAQDATGQWLLATHDGYVATHGLLHERRLFVDARGRELRGEEIVYVTEARGRARYDRMRAQSGRAATVAVRFHLHPAVTADFDPARQVVELALPDGEVWGFRAAGGYLELEDSHYLDPEAAAPAATKAIVVQAEVVDYLAQTNWTFTRLAEPPRALPYFEPSTAS